MTTSKKTAKKAARKTANKASKSVKAAATAASILGLPVTPSGRKKRSPDNKPKVKSDWVKYYNNLLALRDRLIEQMDGLAKESAEQVPGYSLHMADSGTDTFDRDFALSLLSSDQDAVYEIEEAIRRIERQTYGVCELTGKTIPKARLDAIPWTRFTVEAQAQLERDGALRSRRLGSLGSIDSTGAAEVEEEFDADDHKGQKEKD